MGWMACIILLAFIIVFWVLAVLFTLISAIVDVLTSQSAKDRRSGRKDPT